MYQEQTLHCHSFMTERSTCFVQLQGVTQDPVTGNYGMVTRYREHGNLRSCLTSGGTFIQSSYAKINMIALLSQGLAQIHANQIVHYDLHSGNALIGKNAGGYVCAFISDLGLSGPANKSLGDGKIYGVLPYLAPEVIRGNPYTEKADIYSLGMLTWEILTG